MLDVSGIQKQLRTFALERDWEQFHSPKNLVMALTGEIGELSEVFQWLTEEQSLSLTHEQRLLAEEEVADITIYILRLADVLGISLRQVVDAKIEKNAKNYPIIESKGNADKYTRRSK